MRRSVPGLAAVLVAAIAGAAMAAPDPVGTPAPLSLGAAVTLAVGSTPSVQIASLRVSEAEARRWQARSALLPSLSGTAAMTERTFDLPATGIATSFRFPGLTLPDLIGPVSVVDMRLRASQALFDAASWARVRAASSGVEASRAERTGAAESAAQAAASAYVRAARAQALIAAREADLGLAGELASLAEDQVRAGTAARIDVVRARTQQASARGALLVARNQADRALIDLARALGLPAETRFTLTDSLSDTFGSSEVPVEGEAAIRLALAKRPDLAAERARRDRARREQGAIQAERLPRLDAAGDYGLSGMHWHSSMPTRTLTLAASVPIFDGARREGRSAEQRGIARESDVRVGDLERQVDAEVRAALLDVSSGLEQEGVALERLRLAEEELGQAQERFRSGVAGNIEIINAQSSLLRARDALIDARTTAATARIALARAAGVAGTLR